MHLQANHAPRVTTPFAHATCRNPDQISNVYSCTVATRKTASTPDMLCPHTASAMNRQLWLRQLLSAPCAETPYQKKTRNSKFRQNRKAATQNPGLPPHHNMITKRKAAHTAVRASASAPPSAAAPLALSAARAARQQHARHRLPGALRLLRRFPCHLDDKPVVTVKNGSPSKTAVFHGKRLRFGGGFSRTTLAPN